ncbi:MAG: ribosome recycling factor [Hyphomicrobium sp.]|uniref:ribosome recycling factor n=1 Tax=Hyphomicrobium sp. TaxID=82 RepID=UPI0013257536|nr:ribosome recycling factor [Hyphomicrobium sp.]KAB2941106.1 MAG: ribosome recycling factor [Hyphomicrobium sp.]MBZ0211002.1 ribosome recycling factor [Hyphomicrobium sp.]MCZ7595993.1 ribosome recycling factor [Hyphomicrobium sp.]
MPSGTFDLNDLEKRMRGSIEALKRELSGLRTGRASAHLLDPIQVSVYGSKMPLNQVATVSVPEPRTISVQVWDKGNVSAVDKAIREANLGLNPIVDGALLRLPIPTLTAERRTELAKLAHKYAEHGRVAVRNVRREGMDLLKKLEKDHKISQDDHHKSSAKVQELTDRLIKEIDDTLAAKEAEIHKV